MEDLKLFLKKAGWFMRVLADSKVNKWLSLLKDCDLELRTQIKDMPNSAFHHIFIASINGLIEKAGVKQGLIQIARFSCTW